MGIRTAKSSVRPPAVAGLFYPQDPLELQATVDSLLRGIAAAPGLAPAKVLIVPHAGYVYSGPVAAAAYASLKTRGGRITRIVLVGPSHRVYFRGIAVPSVSHFVTPLGDIPVDADTRARLLARGGTIESDEAHAFEHSLEVQLPFLQVALGTFSVLPLLTGDASITDVAELLSAVWGGPETLVVISSDLSHYHAYETARVIDTATAGTILAREPTLSAEQACGALAINASLVQARDAGLAVQEILRLNSGDTAGDRRRVVGYGAWSLA